MDDYIHIVVAKLNINIHRYQYPKFKIQKVYSIMRKTGTLKNDIFISLKK